MEHRSELERKQPIDVARHCLVRGDELGLAEPGEPEGRKDDRYAARRHDRVELRAIPVEREGRTGGVGDVRARKELHPAARSLGQDLRTLLGREDGTEPGVHVERGNEPGPDRPVEVRPEAGPVDRPRFVQREATRRTCR